MGRGEHLERKHYSWNPPTGNWRLTAMEVWIWVTEGFPFNSLMFHWIWYNTSMEQNTQYGTDENIQMCTILWLSCELCQALPLPAACTLLLAQEQFGLGRGRYGSGVTTAITFPPHQLRLAKPLHPSCHCQEQFALYRTTYALPYRKLPLFVSKIIFGSHTSPLPIPSFCDWICFLCDGAGASPYSPAGELGNLLFLFSHYPLVRSERFSQGITAAELRKTDPMNGGTDRNWSYAPCRKGKTLPRVSSLDLHWNLPSGSTAATVAGILQLDRLNWAWERHYLDSGINMPCLFRKYWKQATASLKIQVTYTHSHTHTVTHSK